MIRSLPHRATFLLMAALLGLWGSSAARAQYAQYLSPIPQAQRHTTVELFAESATVAPGKPFTLALKMTPEPGWHTYWSNPGDAGLPTTIAWEMPEGFAAGAIQYPTPDIVPFSGLVNYGYGETNTLLVEITPPPRLPEGPVTLTAKAYWLACDDEMCVPEEDVLSLTLMPGDGASDAASQAFFKAARAALPQAVDWPARYWQTAEAFVLEVAIPLAPADVAKAYFFPAQGGALAYAAPQRVSFTDKGLIIETKSAGAPSAAPLSGVLALTPRGDAARVAFRLTASPSPEPIVGAARPTRAAGMGLALAIAFALLGGVILNLMPCVFPVLSLKALALAKHGVDGSAARQSGVFYTLGIVASFALVAGLLIGLRQAGAAVGWGYQLQSPLVIALLAFLMFAIALNLFGFFEVSAGGLAGLGSGLLARLGGRSQAFMTGVLATLVATPCTAPFMASALAFALAQPPMVAMAVFLSLGLGLALPYLVLSIAPPLRRWLPRPGAWMVAFRQFLAFPMLATALWLVWVIGRQTGLEGVVLILAGFILITFAIWAGRQARGRGARATAMWRIAGVGALIIAALTAMQADFSGKLQATPSAELNEEAFSPQRLAAHRAEGHPVFVYFTADWCITCKVNERLALKTQGVAKAFEAAGVKTLVGDWTRRDPVIGATLQDYGQPGVPLYLYFRPGAVEAEVLPQVLTPGLLIDLVAPQTSS
ncbi:MAG: protein-disulfide reductase DsbD family protein [Pseudomonadota bacterium]